MNLAIVLANIANKDKSMFYQNCVRSAQATGIRVVF
jgi:hypothetical protein